MGRCWFEGLDERMRTRWGRRLALLVAAGLGAFMIYGRERSWRLVAPADLGPVDFGALRRSPRPNDALAASRGLDASADVVLPVYSATPQDVLAEVDARIAALGDEVERVETTPTKRRFVTRSRLMRFPDTTVIEAVPLHDGRTGLRAYARASLGYSDLGANAARLRRWLDDLPLAPVDETSGIR